MGILILLATAIFPATSANAVTQTVISNAAYPVGLAEDSAGNIYIADENNRKLIVYPSQTGTLFGVSVTAGTAAVLLNDTNSFPRGIAINGQDDLFLAMSDGNLKALTSTSKTLFGAATSANTPTTLASGWGNGALEFDSAGNLYGIEHANNYLQVLPASSGTLFGVNVTANTRSVLMSHSGGVGSGTSLLTPQAMS